MHLLAKAQNVLGVLLFGAPMKTIHIENQLTIRSNVLYALISL